MNSDMSGNSNMLMSGMIGMPQGQSPQGYVPQTYPTPPPYTQLSSPFPYPQPPQPQYAIYGQFPQQPHYAMQSMYPQQMFFSPGMGMQSAQSAQSPFQQQAGMGMQSAQSPSQQQPLMQSMLQSVQPTQSTSPMQYPFVPLPSVPSQSQRSKSVKKATDPKLWLGVIVIVGVIVAVYIVLKKKQESDIEAANSVDAASAPAPSQ
jgi:hypothetical protein